MILEYGYEQHTLDALNTNTTECTESFICRLEQELEDGDITEEEAIALIKDFGRIVRT